MGCSASKHASASIDAVMQHVSAPEYSVTAKHPSKVQPARLFIAVDCTAGIEEAGGDADPLSPTRCRRLSHTYASENPEGLAQEAPAEGIDYGCCQCASPTAKTAAPVSTKVPQQVVSVQVACMSKTGCEPNYKKTNQDNCFAFEKYIMADQALFGVIDGHGPNGHFVAGFVRKHLPMLLVDRIVAGSKASSSSNSQVVVRHAMCETFARADAGLDRSGIDCEFSGCTCAVLHLQGRTLTSAWVGDSRMVMGRMRGKKVCGNAWEAIDLSTDHKPSTPEEYKRILKAGGCVDRFQTEYGQAVGPYRVWLQEVRLPGLAMSRAMGDRLAQSVGVTSEPTVLQRELTEDDKVLVLASDGVWEFVSSKEAIDIVAECATPEEACKALVHATHTRWCEEEAGTVDDITAVVVFQHHASDEAPVTVSLSTQSFTYDI